MAIILFIALDAPNWADLMANLFLPLLGSAIIVFCIASFFFPFGQRFKESKQVIKGFGVDLEISVLTLFLLIGFLMSFAGLYLYLRANDLGGLKKHIEELEAGLNAAKRNLEDAGKFTVSVTLQLPDQANIDFAHLEKLECWYYLDPRRETAVKVSVDRGIAANSVRVRIADISPKDVIWRLELREHASDRILGVIENQYPLGPIYPLKRPD